MEKELLKKELAGFTGTEAYHRCWLGFVFTDGVKFLAEKGRCYWLLDVIGSYQNKLEDSTFQIWELKVDKGEGVVTMREDSNLPVRITQQIKYTDFCLDHIKLYFIDGVLLLPSEN